MSYYCQRKYLAALSLFILISVLGGCSLKIFSDGWGLHKKAVEAFNKKDYAGALYLASEAVIADNKLEEPQQFLYEKHNLCVRDLEGELKTLKISRIKDAERNYYILSRLSKYNDNLAKMKLPLEDKDGKWSFNPKIVNYNDRTQKAMLNAQKVLLKYATRNVKKEKFRQAEAQFKRLINIYTPDGSVDKPRYTEIMKSSLSKGYFKRGMRLAKSNSIRTLESAVSDFDNSLMWDSQNERARIESQKIKNRLAEIYYSKAKSFENRNREVAVEAYAMALHWVPGYKDAKQRIIDLFISEELIKLEKNIARTEMLLQETGDGPERLSYEVNRAADAMNKMTYLSDRLRDADAKMKSIGSTLSAFNMIPVVSNATRVVSGTLDKSRRKIHPSVKRFDDLERPVITPTKAKIAEIKNIADQISGNISRVRESVHNIRSAVSEINSCIERQNNPKNLIALGNKAKDLNNHVENVNTSLSYTNRAIRAVIPVVKTISDIQPIVSKAANSANKLARPLDQVGKATHEIDKVLKKNITLKIPVIRKKVSISIHKILTKSVPKIARRILNKFSSLAMKALDPVLNKLKIRIPSVPGLTKIKKGIYDIKYGMGRLKSKADSLRNKVTDLNGNTMKMNIKIDEARRIACTNL